MKDKEEVKEVGGGRGGMHACPPRPLQVGWRRRAGNVSAQGRERIDHVVRSQEFQELQASGAAEEGMRDDTGDTGQVPAALDGTGRGNVMSKVVVLTDRWDVSGREADE